MVTDSTSNWPLNIIWLFIILYRVEKRPLGRPRCRWEDNIKMDIQEVGCRGLWELDGVGSG